MAKQNSAPALNNKGQKFLFYHVGVPIYEGDENHQRMERCRKEFGGDQMKMAKHDAKQVSKFFNQK